MAKLIKTVTEWQQLRAQLPQNRSLGFVPTMGNLHTGHAAMIERCVKENDLTVVSVFVNQTQFNRQRDFQSYPRTIKKDMALAEQLHADYIFVPDYDELYPDDFTYQISETHLAISKEGASRPGHFTGMLTVVMKLLTLIQAKKAYFGEKDYQQLTLVQGLVKAFFIQTEIVTCKTLREACGLPFSSRNSQLSKEQRQVAELFSDYFQSNLDCKNIRKQLEQLGFTVDYLLEENGRRFAAVLLGSVRLIDNIALADLPQHQEETVL